jgi:hypothetical protein
VEKHETQTEVVPVKIGGGKCCQSHPGHFSNLSDITTIMKRE